MKNKITKIVALVLAGSLGVMGLTGCGNQAKSSGEAESGVEQKLAGTVSLAGSTSMEKVCEALMEGFMEKYPDITVTTEYTGSGAGLA